MKKYWAILLTGCMLLALASCGNSGTSGTGADAQGGSNAPPEYVWTLAHQLSAASQQNLGFEKFAADVYEKSNGRIQINVSFGAALGAQRELVEQVNLGTIEMALGEASIYSNYCEEFGLINLPFLFTNEDQYISVATGAVGDQLNDILGEKTNLVNLAWLYGGTRDVYSSKTLTSMDNLKGLKIRTPESPVFVQSFTAMGANPTPVAANEMYTSIQQGVVAAMEGSLETAYTYKIYEVAKSCLRTSHILAGCSLVMNKPLYDSLPDDLKAVIDECAAEMTTYEGQLVADSNADYYDLLADQGVVFTELSDSEKAKAKELVADFCTTYIGDNAVMHDLYQEILASTGQ